MIRRLLCVEGLSISMLSSGRSLSTSVTMRPRRTCGSEPPPSSRLQAGSPPVPWPSTASSSLAIRIRCAAGSTDFLQRASRASTFVLDAGASPLFPPRDIDTARDEVELVLRRAPWHYGVPRSRWRLQDLRRVIAWLRGLTDSGIYKVLKRLGFSRKQALNFVRSPDPEFRAKWEAILRAYQEALEHPDEVVFLFQDEHSYYRDPTKASAWHRRGKTQPRAWGKPGYNKRTRIGAAVNALTGQVIYLQRDEMGVEGLGALYARIRETYSDAKVIYLVQDNWPVHKLPQVAAAREREGLTALFLPTYATWLNPIEKLWRWLKQEVLHVHPFVGDLAQLRKKAQDFLERFTRGSRELLHYLGWPRIIATVTQFVTGLIC